MKICKWLKLLYYWGFAKQPPLIWMKDGQQGNSGTLSSGLSQDPPSVLGQTHSAITTITWSEWQLTMVSVDSIFPSIFPFDSHYDSQTETHQLLILWKDSAVILLTAMRPSCAPKPDKEHSGNVSLSSQLKLHTEQGLRPELNLSITPSKLGDLGHVTSSISKPQFSHPQNGRN